MPTVTAQDVIVLKTSNVQATHSTSPKHARSESVVVVNPTNPQLMVGAAKKFINPDKYDFTLATCYSVDGGQTWAESAPLTLGHDRLRRPWGGISDPALTWDSQYNVFLVALPFALNDGPTLGIAIYKSADGGRTWSTPTVIHEGSDDKQWAAADLSPASPFFGNVYAVWDVGHALCFARTSDHGATWRGVGTKRIAETVLADDSFSPEISVGADGKVYIVYWNRYTERESGPKQVKLVRSVDGGDTFSAPIVVADDITDLEAVLPKKQNWHHFPEGTFRVLTLATACVGPAQELVVAWADGRQIVGVSDVSEGYHVARVFYRRSLDGGLTWQGSNSGQPLLSAIDDFRAHHFHPQLIGTPDGKIGCAFYELGLKTDHNGTPRYLIDVKLAVSRDRALTFDLATRANNRSWDPAVGAPNVHGLTDITFIGEYFGLDGSALGFTLLWTDTRTGMQELFASTLEVVREYRVDSEVGSILFGGIEAGGGGWLILPNGRVRKIPPHEPVMDMLTLLDMYEAARDIDDRDERLRLQRNALRAIARVAQQAIKR
jgi:hypothetical protein